MQVVMKASNENATISSPHININGAFVEMATRDKDYVAGTRIIQRQGNVHRLMSAPDAQIE